MSRVRGLVEAEASLKKQITDLEKKEAVYSRTIQVITLRLSLAVEHLRKRPLRSISFPPHVFPYILPWSVTPTAWSASKGLF